MSRRKDRRGKKVSTEKGLKYFFYGFIFYVIALTALLIVFIAIFRMPADLFEDPENADISELIGPLAGIVLGACLGILIIIIAFILFILGIGQYNLLYTLIPKMPYHASIIWLLHFLVGTLWVHAIHQRFTFKGAKHVSYLTSLFRTYLGYAGTQMGGSIIMLLLCDLGGLHHLIGWTLTTSVTSVLNFIILRSFAIVARENS